MRAIGSRAAIFVAATCLLAACAGPGSEAAAAKECQEQVEAKLRSPTVIFSSLNSAPLGTTGGRFQITGTGAVKNLRGQLVGMTYTCDLAWNDTSGRWGDVFVDVRV
jgi:hypothetical protein